MNLGFYWILKALFSHYWRHPWQSLFLTVGLLSGVALWSAVQIINHHARASYEDAEGLLGAQAQYWIQDRRGEAISQADYIQLRRQGFREIFPVIELDVSTPQGDMIQIIATDLIALPGEQFQESSSQEFSKTWLEFTQPPYRSWVPSILAKELALAEGERLLLRDGRYLPPALIQSREQQGRRIFMDIGSALALQGDPGFSYLAVGSIDAEKYAKLANLLPAQLELIENQQHLDLQQLTASLHTHLSAMSLLSFAVGLFIVFNAVRFSLWYRQPTLLNLRLMGASLGQLVVAISTETVILSLLGTGLGFLLGIALAQMLMPAMGASLQSLYDATVDGELGLSFWSLLQAWLITLSGLALALAWPMYRLLVRTTLQFGGRDAIAADESIARRRLAILAALLAVIASVAYHFISSAFAGFIVLGLVLFAAALAVPMLLASSLRLLESLLPQDNLLLRWVVSDGWSQLPALRSAMTALLLALTANIGVGALVDSFRVAFVGWLEVRQSADLYVRSASLDYSRLAPGVDTQAWLADSHHRIGTNIRWRERPMMIRGWDPDATDSRALPLASWQGDSAEEARMLWRKLPGKALVNEQMHYLAGVKLGDTIALASDQGVRDYEVVGVFYDYGNPQYQVYLPKQEVSAHWQNSYSQGIALWLNHENANAMQEAELALQSLGAEPADWISQVEIRRLSVGIFDRTFAITGAMNLLTLLVAAVALLSSLLAIFQERLPQFAQWRALGVRQIEQLLVIATPLFIFCVIICVLSLPLGGLLSWILIHKLNIVSFGWSMPLLWHFDTAVTLFLLVVAICAATLLLLAYQWRRRMPEALAQLGEVV